MSKIGRRWIQLNYGASDAVRAEDVPYSSTQSVKQVIDANHSGISGYVGANFYPRTNPSGFITTGDLDLNLIGASNVEFLYSGGVNGPFDDVEGALRSALYQPLEGEITVPTTNGIYENGQIINTLTLNWSYNKVIESQILNQGVGSLARDRRTFTHYSINVSTPITYTLTVEHEGGHIDYISKNIQFLDRIYWGIASQASLTDNQIRTLLSSELASTKNKSFSVNPESKYVYICYPSSWGTANILVNGIITSFNLITRSFVNQHGYSKSYNIYRSPYIVGSTISVNIT